MEAIDYITDWNDKHIEVLDELGDNYKAFTSDIEEELMASELIDFQDMEIIQEWGFEYWWKEYQENAKATLNELLEFNQDLKSKFSNL